MSLLLTILAFLQLNPAIPDSLDRVQRDGIRTDSAFISEFIETALHSPELIAQHFNNGKPFIHPDTLGFGYTFIQSATKKAHLVMSYSLLFYNDKLVSYELHPQMPRDDALRTVYRRYFSPLFRFSEDGSTVIPFQWKPERVRAPISDTRFQLVNSNESDKDILELMTPYVGIWYEAADDLTPYSLLNRRSFENVKDTLKPSSTINLLHSINPAVRLMTIEHVRRAKGLHGIDPNAFQHDVSLVFAECPRIHVEHGDVLQWEDARQVIDRYSSH